MAKKRESLGVEQLAKESYTADTIYKDGNLYGVKRSVIEGDKVVDVIVAHNPTTLNLAIMKLNRDVKYRYMR